MGFKQSNSGVPFKTESRRFKFVVGYGVVIELEKGLLRKYDEKVYGGADEPGFLMTGPVLKLLGANLTGDAQPALGDVVTVLLRATDTRKAIFDDLEKTREDSRFLLEGVSMVGDRLEARWAHGAGENRSIQELEIVSSPHVAFENPVPEDGLRNGWLSLNLDGSPTMFDVLERGGGYVKRELAFDAVVTRLEMAMEKGLKFRVSQRVLVPSLARGVHDQAELESVLTQFRADGMTACVVRSFVPGTTDPAKVDVQLMSWPEDVPASANASATVYKMPVLQDTKRFVALRDGEEEASMEVIPGYVLNLLGNKDIEKSTKHKFVRQIIRGLSNGQKNMYGTQNYGPGFAICAVSDDGLISGLTRLAIRTDGVQFITIGTIPTVNFPAANLVEARAEGAVPDAVS